MQDGIIKGTGNSRYLKSIADFLTQYPTYNDFAAALAAGTLPIDLNGINETGWDQLGTALNKTNLLSDETATALGLTSEAVPDDAWKAAVHGASPAGSIFWYAAQTPPSGFLVCDGSTISRTDYVELFSAIGTTFGGGNGSTTFSLPDLRALFIRGSGNQGGYSATFAQKQEASIVYAGAPYQASGYLSVTVGNADKVERFSNQSRSMYGNGGANANSNINYIRPYNIALTPIIKY